MVKRILLEFIPVCLKSYVKKAFLCLLFSYKYQITTLYLEKYFTHIKHYKDNSCCLFKVPNNWIEYLLRKPTYSLLV